MKQILTIFLFSLLKSNEGYLKNYCSPKLCGNDLNTACRNTGKFASKCPPGIRLVAFNATEKEIMLETLNSYRSTLALGGASNATGFSFPPAKNMYKLVWDEEQAFMASLHLRTCGSHDPCHDTYYNTTTRQSVHSGQNLYNESSYYPIRAPLEDVIKSAAKAWFIEIGGCDTEVVPYVYIKTQYITGHFLQMSHDKSSRVGCAASQWEDPPDRFGVNKNWRITCNFFRSPFLFRPLYEAGETCSGCPDSCDWDSEDTSGLCIIDPDSFADTFQIDL